MSEGRQLLLEELRAELAFILSGGCPNPVRGRWRPQFIFEHSAMCLNRDPTQESMPYTERVLARFVRDESPRFDSQAQPAAAISRAIYLPRKVRTGQFARATTLCAVAIGRCVAAPGTPASG